MAKAKGILITSPKIAIGSCSSCPGSEGALPAPRWLGAGEGTVPRRHRAVKALTPLAAGGHGKHAVTQGAVLMLGAARAGAQCGGVGRALPRHRRRRPGCLLLLQGCGAGLLSHVSGKATPAELQAVGQPHRPQRPRCHGVVCGGLRSPAPPAPGCSGHGAGDWGTAGGEGGGGEAGVSPQPWPGCQGPAAMGDPGWARGRVGAGVQLGPGRALRPRSGACMSSDGRCPRRRAPSPWGCSRPAW